MFSRIFKYLAISALIYVPALAGNAQDYPPFINDSHPNRVFFGDTHVHTKYSVDAGLFVNDLGPDAAYRFAKGEVVSSSSGVKTRLRRPLDFFLVADHAENLGLTPMALAKDPLVMNNDWGKQFADLLLGGDLAGAYELWGARITESEDPFAGDQAMPRAAWHEIVDAAEAANQPGVFTAFIGFEWTSAPGGSNLHRNVLFRDSEDRTKQILPYSAYDSEDPEDLWQYMSDYEESTGGRVIAIAHNGNLSNGLMFDDKTLSGEPLDKDYVLRRIKAEPLYEVTQMKGDGETHPLLSPTDEFADFGTWDKGSFSSAKEPGMINHEYAREAYKHGLQYRSALGVNPFKLGLIGSTDTHTSLATSTEDNFFGKAGLGEPTKGNEMRFNQMVTGFLPDPQGREYAILHQSSLASGLAAVWAEENTREAIFDAMERKEVYATSGTRLTVRVFAGWDFQSDDLHHPDFARYGYQNGVPMGGDLKRAKQSSDAPRLLVKAAKDPDWANLDRIQVVKGWVDKRGHTHERIYDVAVSDGREINDNGRCEVSVGNTVDVDSASFSNSIGDAVLEAYWQDPDFDREQQAFYYVRVLEIPTPNWTVYDAKLLDVSLPEGEPTSIQDRAYTSQIWYMP